MSQIPVQPGFIGDNAVTSTEIAANAVTTDKIIDNAVTTDKIIDNAVTTDRIAASAVTASPISDGSITPVKLSPGRPTWDASGTLNITGAAEVQNSTYLKLGDAYISSGYYAYNYPSAPTFMYPFSLAHFGTNTYFTTAYYDTTTTVTSGTSWQTDGRGPGGLYQIYATPDYTTFPYRLKDVTHIWHKHNGGSGIGVYGITNLMFLNDSGILQTEQGYRCRAGAGGGISNVFNIFWNGEAQLWIDNVFVGNINRFSDYRIKKNVQTQISPAIERVSKLNSITYEYQDYKELFKEDGVQREGFIAHELAEVIPSAVEGEKDAANEIQSLRLDSLVSVLTKALQEAIGRIETLDAEVAELKNLK
jgi:hypothetical protein